MAFKKITTKIEYPLAKGHSRKVGDLLVNEGILTSDQSSEKYPTSVTYLFEQRKDGKTIGLGGKWLEGLVKSKKIKFGKCYNIYFEGMKATERGDAYNFSFEEDDAPAVKFTEGKETSIEESDISL